MSNVKLRPYFSGRERFGLHKPKLPPQRIRPCDRGQPVRLPGLGGWQEYDDGCGNKYGSSRENGSKRLTCIHVDRLFRSMVNVIPALDSLFALLCPKVNHKFHFFAQTFLRTCGGGD